MASEKVLRPPTAYDVARLAGVSQSAVSRAFTGGASISPKLRTRVLAAAEQLGYRPNIVARALTQHSTNVVGVVVGHLENPFFSEALDQLGQALGEHGLRILLFTAQRNAQADSQVAELLSHRVTAVILMAVDLSSSLTAECVRSGISVVMFNRTTRLADGAFSITGDNVGGAMAIARRFGETGRQRFVFMAGYEDSSTSQEREMAFRDALSTLGLPEPVKVVGGYSRDGAVAATRALFTHPATAPDAIFCANDLMAIATIETMRGEFAVEPGGACAVAGFDDIAMANWPSFDLTTFSQPIPQMVRHAVQCVTGAFEGAGRVIVPGELKVRKTA